MVVFDISCNIRILLQYTNLHPSINVRWEYPLSASASSEVSVDLAYVLKLENQSFYNDLYVAFQNCGLSNNLRRIYKSNNNFVLFTDVFLRNNLLLWRRAFNVRNFHQQRVQQGRKK